MRIGILTFVNTTNYGASLQAFALQQAIIEMGNECEIIKYVNRKVFNNHDPKAVFRRKGIKKVFAPLLFIIYKNRMKKFRKFENEFCFFSDDCNRDNIIDICEKYDRIVVGSDQVWNLDITEDDKTFFLDFIKDDNKKYTYAASVGTNWFSENRDASEYEQLIRKFKIISVREQNTLQYIQNRVGREDATCDLDPTFLIHNSWNKFIGEKKFKADYIFMYLIPDDKMLYEAVRCFAKRHNCKVILLKKGAGKRKGIRVINIASPTDFINLIAHAKYVIAGSFHAICFSIMLEKEFYATSSIEPERRVRLTNLLEKTELSSRMITGPNYVFEEENINYFSVKENLEKQIEKSLETLRVICE